MSKKSVEHSCTLAVFSPDFLPSGCPLNLPARRWHLLSNWWLLQAGWASLFLIPMFSVEVVFFNILVAKDTRKAR